MKPPTDKLVEKERRARLRELGEELGPGGFEQFGPGTFGCHELLDRLHVLGDVVEQQILEHASCIQNPHWYALADRAVKALRELYQRVGAAHLDNNHASGSIPDKPARRRRTG